MSERKHTPGPWRMDHDGTNWVVVTDDYPEMVDVWGFNEMPAVEAVANARLIAAAPDLLEALDDAMDMLGSRLIKDTFGYEWHEKARAAIAKATGESK